MALIKFILNSKPMEIDVDPSIRLIDFLRHDMQLISVKEGCGEGGCGACVVLVNGLSMNSCLLPIANVMNKEVVTLESLKLTKEFEILSLAFAEEGGSQCGFCTPGMIIASYSLLKHNPNPSDEQIKEAISGNICRCSGYQSIINAIKLAVKLGGDIWARK